MNRYDFYKEIKFDDTEFDSERIEEYYDQGFKFVRSDSNYMQSSRSIRINLKDFTPSSENRRILRKNAYLKVDNVPLPLQNYDWRVSKLAHDFYLSKFGENYFSVNKVRDLLLGKFNFNRLLKFTENDNEVGYSICYASNNILHYCYPFYSLERMNDSLGIGMMTLCILKAKEESLDFVYLGSANTKSDVYKLQFSGLEWWDNDTLAWSNDINSLKKFLSE